MDVITELLPPTNLVKSETASKDKKQKKKHENPPQADLKVVEVKPDSVVKARFSNWNSVDRRTGDDRRKQLNKRGRWLESRDRSNRRTLELEQSVSMKI